MTIPRIVEAAGFPALLAALGRPEGFAVGGQGPLPLKAALAFARLLAAASRRPVPVHALWPCGRREEAASAHPPGRKR